MDIRKESRFGWARDLCEPIAVAAAIGVMLVIGLGFLGLALGLAWRLFRWAIS